MSRLVDYFIVTGYDHDKDRKLILLRSKGLRLTLFYFLVGNKQSKQNTLAVYSQSVYYKYYLNVSLYKLCYFYLNQVVASAKEKSFNVSLKKTGKTHLSFQVLSCSVSHWDGCYHQNSRNQSSSSQF